MGNDKGYFLLERQQRQQLARANIALANEENNRTNLQKYQNRYENRGLERYVVCRSGGPLQGT